MNNKIEGTRFASIPHWVLDADVTDRALRLYAVLTSYTAGQGGKAWPSRKTLAERLGCSTDTVDRCVRELIDLGAVVVERQYTTGPNGGSVPSSNTYLVLFDDPRLVERGVAARERVLLHGAPTPTRTGAPTPTRTGAALTTPTVEPHPGEPHKPPSAKAEALPSRPTDDPVKRAAHRLTVMAFEQPVKPDVRGEVNPFPAVMALVERTLRSGRSVLAVEHAITAGVDVWTLAGLQTAIAKTRSGGNRQAGVESVIDELAGGAM